MPAVSKAQQRLMAMALHNPKAVRGENKGVLSMSDKQLSDFASTPTKKLPKHKNSLRAMVEGDAKVARKVAKGRK